MDRFIIRKAAAHDLHGIMEIMEEAKDNKDHPDWFVPDDLSYVEYHMGHEGFIMVAVTPEGQTAGFFVIKEPVPEDNLARFLDFTDDQMERVLHMDSAAVRKSCRGNGLQGRMLRAAEAEVDRNRFRYLMCTVHPDNRYSLSNMTGHGYRIMKKVKCCGGLDRYVLLKDLEETE